MNTGVKHFKNQGMRHLRGVQRLAQRYWFRSFFIVLLGYAFYQQNIQIYFGSDAATSARAQNVRQENAQEAFQGANRSLFSVNPFKKLSPEERARLKKQQRYVDAYLDIARQEMLDHGIPASITLAQGLLESDAGESTLATRNNNHFGIKCFSRKCKRGHCSNFEDDSHKDFFRVFKDSEESFRAHSRLLKAPRYQPLFQNDLQDYASWAKGLKAAGYATDPKYAEKLIELIEELQLYQYDY
jgi:flagellum-specific peptidoglycan hydrolase FlgJ